MTDKIQHNKTSSKITTDLKEECSEVMGEVKEQFSEIQDTVVAYVKKHPLKSIGFSLLAGMLVAQIMRSTKDK